MVIDIIAVIPDSISGYFTQSIMRRAQEKGLCSVNILPLRPYGLGRSLQVDDYAYGGEAGMVLRPEPLAACIDALLAKNSYDEIIYLTPDGDDFDQPTANALSLTQRLMMICGHYKGIDQRIRDHYVTRELSIGDYVISSGELAAAVVADAIVRLIPGVLSDESSALSDSHQDGLLAPPVYTRPAVWRGREVPEVLLSGHEASIKEWQEQQSELKTKLRTERE